MNHPFSVKEVRCPACGHPNFPPAAAWLKTRATSYCGRCGANLLTGRSDLGTVRYHYGALAAAYVLAAIVGAFLGMIALALAAWALFPRDPADRLRVPGAFAGIILGAVAGIVLVDRNRRRGGFSGPKTARSAERESRAAFIFVAVWMGGAGLFQAAERLGNSPGLLAVGGLAFLGGLVYALVRVRRARKAPGED